MIVRWPGGGVQGGRVIDAGMSNIDVFTTMLELIGEPVPDTLEGMSFAPALRGAGPPPNRRHHFALIQEGPVSRGVRTDKYKLIRNFHPHRSFIVPVENGTRSRKAAPVVELYDLENDPLETKNLADDPDHNEICAELSKALYEHLKRVSDPILKHPVPVPYYKMALDDFAETAR